MGVSIKGTLYLRNYGSIVTYTNVMQDFEYPHVAIRTRNSVKKMIAAHSP